jgi:hypothetical protein
VVEVWEFLDYSLELMNAFGVVDHLSWNAVQQTFALEEGALA